MSTTVLSVIIGIAAFALGAGICYLIFRFTAIGLLKKAEEEAEIIKKNKIVEAKEKFIALKLEHDACGRTEKTAARTAAPRP